MGNEIIFLVHPFFDVQASLEALRNNNKLPNSDEKIQRLLLCLRKARFLIRTYFTEVANYLENNPRSVILAIKPNYLPFPEVTAYIEKLAKISNRIVIISPELINTSNEDNMQLEKSHMRINGKEEVESILEIGKTVLLDRGFDVKTLNSKTNIYKVAGEWKDLCVNQMRSGIIELFPDIYQLRSSVPEITEFTFGQLDFYKSPAIIERGKVINIK